eukprot:jgi/Psemu1/14418/gm1.14418_g
MPTRIVLSDPVDSRNNTPRFRSTDASSRRTLSTTTSVVPAIASDNRTDSQSTPRKALDSSMKRKSSRRVVQLKSSIIRSKKGSESFRALSSEDIRASPRLLGYCFQLLASIVMLISVSTFLGDDDEEDMWDLFNATNIVSKKLYYRNESRAVFAWKLFGCFVVSGLGTIVTLGIILVHFDTIFFPTYWLKIFRDGSKNEQVLLILLAIFWGVGLHINTSSLSVGESQANIFFTSWISFFSAILNYGIWRVSAGRVSIADLVIEHHRETT